MTQREKKLTLTLTLTLNGIERRKVTLTTTGLDSPLNSNFGPSNFQYSNSYKNISLTVIHPILKYVIGIVIG